jgi:hypothetical protein
MLVGVITGVIVVIAVIAVLGVILVRRANNSDKERHRIILDSTNSNPVFVLMSGDDGTRTRPLPTTHERDPASGRRGAADGSPSAVTGDYEEPVPVDYAEASDHPSGLQGHNGGAAVNLDRDMYVSNGPAVRDDVDSYELPMLPAVLPPASNNGMHQLFQSGQGASLRQP